MARITKTREKLRRKNQLRTRPIVEKSPTSDPSDQWYNTVKTAIKEHWPTILQVIDPRLKDCIQLACTPINPKQPKTHEKTIAAIRALARPDPKLRRAIQQLECDIIACTDNTDPTRWIEFAYTPSNKRDRAIIKLRTHQLQHLKIGWYSLPEPTIDGRNMGLKLAINQHTIDRITTRLLEHDHISTSLWWFTRLILLSTPKPDRYQIIHPIYQDIDLTRSIVADLADHPTPLKPYLKLGSFIIQPNDNRFHRHLTCRTYVIPTSRTPTGTKSHKVTTNTRFSEIQIKLSDHHQFNETIALIDPQGYLHTTEPSHKKDHITIQPTNIKLKVIQ